MTGVELILKPLFRWGIVAVVIGFLLMRGMVLAGEAELAEKERDAANQRVREMQLVSEAEMAGRREASERTQRVELVYREQIAPILQAGVTDACKADPNYERAYALVRGMRDSARGGSSKPAA